MVFVWYAVIQLTLSRRCPNNVGLHITEKREGLISLNEIMWDVIGTLGFALMIAAIIVFMKFLSKIGDRITSRAYTPLAQAVGGRVDMKGPWIVMTHRGWQLRAALDPQTNIGMGESSRSIKTFWVQVLEVPGRSDWTIRHNLPGLFKRGPLQLGIETSDSMLANRLAESGVYEVVAAGSSATTYYVAARYEAWNRTLRLVDDVSQYGLPGPESLLKSAELAVRIAEINLSANPLS
jgi:hypothetical protein